MTTTLTRAGTKKTRAPKPGKKRYRRTELEIISDLEAEIDRLKRRKAAKKAKRSPEMKLTVDALRSISTAIDATSDAPHRKALEEAQVALAAYLKLEGIPMPKKRGRRKARGSDE